MHKNLFLPILGSIALQGAVYASMFASGGDEVLLDDGTVTHTFRENGSLVIKETKPVRILVVGGGGGGGAECGGGGGGGGVIEQLSYVLSPGEYSISIGAGGKGGFSKTDYGNGGQRGTNGGDTTFIDADGNVLFRAYGGGGGGSWQVRSGAAGASGGGAAATGSGGISVDPTQGNIAGDAIGGSTSLPTGGAGAGGPSSSINLSRGQGMSGTGGVGVISDISGKEEMYGAGGGGGNYNYGNALSQAPGGDGIGGFGQGNTSQLSGNEKGRDGYGGGGGGGSNVTTYIAADGGSGVVIIRIAASEDAALNPNFVISNKKPSVDSITFALSVAEVGSESTDKTVSIYAQVAENESAWNGETGEFSGKETLLASGVGVGNVNAILCSLLPAHEYVVRLIARNDAGAEETSGFIHFETAPLVDERWTIDGIAGEPGLLQYTFSDNGNNDIDKEFDYTSPGLTVQVGAIIAGVSNTHQNGIHGGSYTDANGNVWVVGAYLSYAYMGYMFMEADVTYNFFKHYYDGTRLEIEGENIIYSRDYGKAIVASYVPQRTGWHKIRIWLTAPAGNGFGVPPEGWTFGLGFNTNGVTDILGKPGDAWVPIENTSDNVFLRTVPMGRELEISSWSIDSDANSAVFNLTYGEALSETELYAVWGPMHGGDTLDGWTHKEKIGVIDVNSGTATFTLDDISDLVWFKFVAVEESGLLSWSQSQFVDLSNPVIGISKVVHCGDQATISVRVDSVGTGDFSLKLLWGENEDLSGASVTNVAVTTPGTYDVVVDVTPGATTYFKAEAETSDGGRDSTKIDSFTTLAGASMNGVTASVANHWVTFAGAISSAGASDTIITLWIGDSPETLAADPEVICIPTTGPFSFRRLFPGELKTIYWKFTYENVASGGTTWISETPVSIIKTNENEVEYHWKADVLDGEWKNPNNWTTRTEGAIGYPADYRTLVYFPNNSTNRIHLAGYAEGRVVLNYSNSDITIYGDGADVSYLYTGDSQRAATLNRSTFRLDNVTLEEFDMFDYTFGADSTTNSSIVVTNNACLNLGGGKWAIVGNGTSLYVSADSKFYFGDRSVSITNKLNKIPNGYNPIFGAQGESLTLEGVASMSRIYLATPLGEEKQSFRLRGSGAQLRVIDGIIGDFESLYVQDHRLFYGDQTLTRDMDIVFEPSNGNYTNTITYVVDDVEYTEAVPFVSIADNDRAFAGMLFEESTGKLRISVDTATMKNSIKSTRQHLILWKSGIDTDNVELVQGDDYTLHYTYGWPSTATEPTAEGELPTGIWGNVPCKAATVILIF